MSVKEPSPETVVEEPMKIESSKKRKNSHEEIEVDVSLPEPPSKKAKRALKKGKKLPPKANSPEPERDAVDGEGEADGDGKNATTDGTKTTAKERSPYGVWIGNLRFSTTKDDLRQWLLRSSGGVLTEDLITRIHMPLKRVKPERERLPFQKTSAQAAAAAAKLENKGFAHVDFSTAEANTAAIALSEIELNGRKLLVKDVTNFEGRPEKKKKEDEETGDGADPLSNNSTDAAKAGKQDPFNKASKKIFVGNLDFNATQDSLYDLFSKCGDILWCKVASFEDTGKCKGYGWVMFKESEAAAHAVKGFVKVPEMEETVEDFMDSGDEDAGKVAAAGEVQEQEIREEVKQEVKDETASKEQAEAVQNEEEAEEEQEEKPKKKIKLRKWWVNRLNGRTLKIELAEDDQTRYRKRFGKDRPLEVKQAERAGKAERRGGGRPSRGADDRSGGAAAADDAGTGTTAPAAVVKKEVGKVARYEPDIKVARLTGAVVASTGKKTSLE